MDDAFALAASIAIVASALHAAEIECPPGSPLRVEEPAGGRIEMCVDEEGKLDGPARLFRDGVLRREDSWSHGTPHGGASIYDEHGVLRERRFHQAGLLAGRETFFHPNGLKRTETEYRENVKSGVVGEWDERGRQVVDGFFLAGDPHGLWWFAPPRDPVYAKVFEAGEALHPLDPGLGCAGWVAAGEGERSLFVASLEAVALNALPPEAIPEAPPGPLAVAHCMEFASELVEHAVDAECSAEAPELAGPITTRTVAAVAAKCAKRTPR